MELEKQVVSLDLSKKLKELGVKQESLFYWHRSYDPFKQQENEPYVLFAPNNKAKEIDFSAYTVAELGELLPSCSRFQDGKVWDLAIASEPEVWEVMYHSVVREETLNIFIDRSEANARAKMLIYLLENKLIQLS